MRLVVCPTCKATIDFSSRSVSCCGGHEFPIIEGIIDLIPNISDKGLLNEEKHWDQVASEGRMKIMPDSLVHKKSFEDLRAIFEQFIISEWPDFRNRSITVGEIGCGSGSGMSYLGRIEFANVDYIGQDISIKSMLKAVTRPAHWNIQFIRSDANVAFLKENSLDILLATSVLHHLQLDMVIEWISKTLKFNGLFILNEPSMKNPLARVGRKFLRDFHTQNERPLSPEKVKQLASDYGLQLVYERGFHFISGPLQYLLGILCSPKLVSILIYYLARQIDMLVTSTSWNYEFVQIYKKTCN